MRKILFEFADQNKVALASLSGENLDFDFFLILNFAFVNAVHLVHTFVLPNY